MLKTLAVRCSSPSSRKPLWNVWDSHKLVMAVLDGTRAPRAPTHKIPWHLDSLLLQYSALQYLRLTSPAEVPEFLRIMSKLTSLVLQDSNCPGFLLDLLTASSVEINLQKLVIVNNSACWRPRSSRPSDLTRAVDRFLERFPGLQTLAISGLPPHQLPSAKSINKHSKTLRELFIDNETPMHMKSSEDLADWFTSICNACIQVEQVGLPMPWITFWRRGYRSIFELKSGRMRHVFTEAPMFISCMGHLQGLPKLVTLRMTKVGLCSPDRKWAAERAGLLAEEVFANFRRVGFHELSLVAFGQERHASIEREERMLCYFVESGKALQNNAQFRVVSMSKAEAMKEEPRSTILDIQHDMPGLLSVD